MTTRQLLNALMLEKMKSDIMGKKYPWDNAIDFFTNPKFLGADLFPNQRLLLKLWNLQTDFDDREKRVLDQWTHGFENEDYRSGVSSNVLERIEDLKAKGCEWFPNIIAVMGRRAGKTFMTGLQLSYCMACYLWTNGFGIKLDDLGHEPNLIVMATTALQAQGTIFTDLLRAVTSNPYFDPFMLRAMQTKIEFATLPDQLKNDIRHKNHAVKTDLVSVKARAVSSDTRGSRGWAIPFFAFDEGFFAMGGESARSGDEAITALLPSLTQFYPHSMAIFPSSPRTRTGKLYQMYADGLQSGCTDTLICQLESWRMYEDCGDREPMVVAPDINGNAWQREMANKERTDQIGFKREYRAQFVDSSFVYFDPEMVKRMFVLPHETMRGTLGVQYRIHCDPARVGDDFSIMVGHMEGAVLKLDYYTVFRPSDFPNGIINYTVVEQKIETLIQLFNPISVTFDQFNSAMMIDRITNYVRSLGFSTQVAEETATKDKNTDMYQRLKITINSEQVQSYVDNLNIIEKDRCLLEASLDMVEEVNMKVYKPRIPGFGHLDLVDCLAVINYQFRNNVTSNDLHLTYVAGINNPWNRF